MRIIDPILMELDQEAATTRRVLERVPEDRLTWKPHPKSMSLGELALHVAQAPGAVANLANVDEYDLPQFSRPVPSSKAEILSALDESIANAKQILNGFDDARCTATWKLTKGGTTLLSIPRIGFIRSVLMNHVYHHRGQLSVYLRLLDVPVPSIYGPSADESPFAQAT